MIKKINQVTIVGLGMMGASLALALKKGQLAEKIVGVDVDAAVVQKACAQGITDVATLCLAEGIKDADLVVLSTPVGKIVELIKALADLNYQGFVTDLGSTKKAVCDEAEKYAKLNFVGSHPMAGSEMAGIPGAKDCLFENAPVIITATPRTPVEAVEFVTLLWKQLKARLLFMEPEDHDFSVSIISHLPHVVSITTMNTACSLAGEKEEVFSIMAGGFRDTTRIAGADPYMWRDIFLTNRIAVLQGISEFRAQLDQLEQAIFNMDSPQLTEILTQAQSRRRRLVPAKGNTDF